MHYHPGAMLKNRWTCCNQRGKTSLGCQPTYHLLTRSSSRYAQMRRKDTLSGSTSPGRRRSKVTSAYKDRRSASSANQNEIEIEVSIETPRRSPPAPAGVGISNSCVELRESPPHRPEIFATETPGSQRSSQVSTEPSVSMSSITFTRVSVLEAPPSEHGSEADQTSVFDVGMGGSIDRRLRLDSARHGERDRRSGSNRSQVAPEPAAMDHRHLGQLEPEEKPVVIPREQSLGNRTVLNLAHGRDGAPPVPPRKRCTSHTVTPTQFVPSVTPITETSCEPKMRHSQTFVVSLSRPPLHSCPLSSSLQALARPTIAPRVSSTDPNIIHV